jgi:hypothetical protein
MAKFKPAGSKKSKSTPDSKRGLLPCAFIILLGFALIFWLFYLVLRSRSGS